MMSELQKKVMDEWARDVIKWATEELNNNNYQSVVEQAENIITAVLVTVREEYRKEVLDFIEAILKTAGINSGMNR